MGLDRLQKKRIFRTNDDNRLQTIGPKSVPIGRWDIDQWSQWNGGLELARVQVRQKGEEMTIITIVNFDGQDERANFFYQELDQLMPKNIKRTALYQVDKKAARFGQKKAEMHQLYVAGWIDGLMEDCMEVVGSILERDYEDISLR